MTSRGLGGAKRRPAPRGMVTAELALGIVTATVLTCALITLLMLGVNQAALAESSAEIARQIARGDDAASTAAEERSPGKATIKRASDGVQVLVEGETFVFGIGTVPLQAESFAAWEPGEGP